MTANQRREYKEGYDMHNRCLYQSLIHCCSGDIEARAILMSPLHAKETKGLEAWKALLHKHTDVSNVAKLATIHKLLSLSAKQGEDETPELYMIREQSLFHLVQSQIATEQLGEARDSLNALLKIKGVPATVIDTVVPALLAEIEESTSLSANQSKPVTMVGSKNELN
jgi:hypothetical protein